MMQRRTSIEIGFLYHFDKSIFLLIIIGQVLIGCLSSFIEERNCLEFILSICIRMVIVMILHLSYEEGFFGDTDLISVWF